MTFKLVPSPNIDCVNIASEYTQLMSKSGLCTIRTEQVINLFNDIFCHHETKPNRITLTLFEKGYIKEEMFSDFDLQRVKTEFIKKIKFDGLNTKYSNKILSVLSKNYETNHDFSSFVNPLVGPVRYMEEYHSPISSDFALFTYSSFGVCNLNSNDPKTVCGFGKGNSNDLRKKTCIAELIERYMFNVVKPHKKKYRSVELDSNYVVELNDIQSLSGTQKQELVIDWVKGKDIFNDKELYLPFESGYSSPYDYRSSTNGWAVHIDERADINALLEIIERDAVVLSWLSKNFGFKVDSYENDILSALKTLGFHIELYIITKDIGVPVIFGHARCLKTSKFHNIAKGASFFSAVAALTLKEALNSVSLGLLQKFEMIATTQYYHEKQVVTPIDHRNYYLNPRNWSVIEQGIQSHKQMPIFSEYTHENPKQNDIRYFLANKLVTSGYQPFIVDYSDQVPFSYPLRVVKANILGTLPVRYGSDQLEKNKKYKLRIEKYLLNNTKPNYKTPHVMC